MRFEIDVTPIPQKRPRAAIINRRVVMYDDRTSKIYKVVLGAMFEREMIGTPKYDSPVKVEIDFTLPIAKSWPAKKQAAALSGELAPMNKAAGDIDNLVKACLDAANGKVWIDDSQVVEITARKRYGREPGLVMTVEAWRAT